MSTWSVLISSLTSTLTLREAKLAESKATLKEAQVKDKRLKELNKLSGGKMPSRTDLDAGIEFNEHLVGFDLIIDVNIDFTNNAGQFRAKRKR